MMRYMVGLRLFERAEGVIMSENGVPDGRIHAGAAQKNRDNGKRSPEVSPESVPSLSRSVPESRDTNGRKSVLIEENRKRDNNTGRRFTPPTPTEVSEYAASAGITIAPDRFCNFYASKGWKVGKTPMKGLESRRPQLGQFTHNADRRTRTPIAAGVIL